MKSAVKLNKQKFNTLAILIAAICATLVLVGLFYAKYKKELNFSGNVTISVNLADSFTLTEHEVTQNPDGSFDVNNDKVVEANKYYVLPGIDIPKDPTISITGKTNVDAYLFIEVVDRVDHSVVKFELDSHWQAVDGANSLNGGTVYVFCQNGVPAILNDKTDADLISSIGIIKDDVLKVTRYTKDENGKDLGFYSATGVAVDLDFYGCLLQINTDDVTVADVYNKLTPVDLNP